MNRYIELKEKYPHFIYQDYDYKIVDTKLEGRFTYLIKNEKGESAFEFFTSFTIDYNGFDGELDTDVDTMVYNLGLVEAISYWKLTCAPKFTIRTGVMDHWQRKWWQKLFKKGLSEFFYLNTIIDWDESQLEFEESYQYKKPPVKREYNTDKVIVPIGGGKDSIATTRILYREKDIVPLVMNPIKASLDFIDVLGKDSYIKITRKLDPQIVKLNAEGFLNGHIPFSAVLSFYSMIAARMYGIKDIALSNESSANEPTILGTDINHQYSKSLEYEKDIAEYSHRYLDSDIRYFSMLRPFNEYQITKIFARSSEQVLQLFRSCNKGSKQGIWCCKCPKCLFTYIMIHAHLPKDRMLMIYGADLLEDGDLKGYFLSLTGQRTEKPFECVGTVEEVNAALQVVKQKYDDDLPALFEHWSEDLVERSANQLLAETSEHRLDTTYSALMGKHLVKLLS